MATKIDVGTPGNLLETIGAPTELVAIAVRAWEHGHTDTEVYNLTRRQTTIICTRCGAQATFDAKHGTFGSALNQSCNDRLQWQDRI